MSIIDPYVRAYNILYNIGNIEYQPHNSSYILESVAHYK